MSNRLLGLLIIFAFIGAGVGFYMYSFITYTGSIYVQANVGEYSVEIENKKTLTTMVQECSEKICILNNVPPFSYNITVIKPGYKTHQDTLSVGRRGVEKISLFLYKDTKLIQNNIGTLNKKIISAKDKIQSIQNSKHYGYFKIKNFGEIFFKKVNNKLLNIVFKNELGKEKNIAKFTKIHKKSTLNVQKIIGTEESIVLSYGKEYFIYDNATAQFSKLDIEIPIKYIKIGNTGEYNIITEKGLFVYSGGDFEYRGVFTDFIIIDGYYIGVIHGDDRRRKKNFGFKEHGGDIIVLYNPQSKEKRILLEADFIVGKIFLQDASIIIQSTNGSEFILENY